MIKINSKYIKIKEGSKKYLFTDEGYEFAKDFILNQKQSYSKLAKIFEINEDTCRIMCHENNISKDNRRKYKINEKYFDIIDTKEKAYWLGFIAADGTVGSKRYSLVIDLQRQDKQHIEKFAKAIETDSPVYDKIVLDKYLQSGIRLDNKHMHQSLINHGCVPNKSLILKPPEIDDDLKLYWILGYFDGDGYISVYYSGGKYLRLQTGFTGTYEVLSFIKEYLGWNQSLRQEHRCTNNTYRLQATENHL